MQLLENTFEIGQTVYLCTDGDQAGRIVTGIIVRPRNSLVYELSCGNQTSCHYDFEITAERDVMKVTTD